MSVEDIELRSGAVSHPQVESPGKDMLSTESGWNRQPPAVSDG